jgi:hypothetical protein
MYKIKAISPMRGKSRQSDWPRMTNENTKEMYFDDGT